MRPTPLAVVGVLLAALAVTPVAAQRRTLLRPQSTPEQLEILNIFRFYHLEKGDTIGSWVNDLSTREQRWSGGRGDTLRVELFNHEMGVGRPPSVDTLELLPNGRTVSIGGRPVGASKGPIDWFPRLPKEGVVFRVGATWADTLLLHEGEEQVYNAFRQYTVRRRLDTLGVKAWEVVGVGTLRYRMTSIRDSAAMSGRWWDVTGPVVDTFWIDPAAGRILGRKWWMDLHGTSAPFPAAPGDTTVAGLPSRETVKRVSPARYAAMIAGIPEGDTLYSVYDGRITLRHTHRVNGDSIREGMARGDGMFGSNTLVFSGAVPSEGWAVWVDSLETRPFHFKVEGGRVRIDGGASFQVPAGSWAVADYGMDGMLIPALLQIPADGDGHDLTIYRPWPAKWDTVQVTMRVLTDGWFAVMQGRDGKGKFMMFDQARNWYFSGDSQDRKSLTYPPDNSPLMPALQTLIGQLRQSNGN